MSHRIVFSNHCSLLFDDSLYLQECPDSNKMDLAYVHIVVVYIKYMSIHIYNGLKYYRNSVTRMTNLFYRMITRAFCFPLYLNLISSPLIARICSGIVKINLNLQYLLSYTIIQS